MTFVDTLSTKREVKRMYFQYSQQRARISTSNQDWMDKQYDKPEEKCVYLIVVELSVVIKPCFIMFGFISETDIQCVSI